MSENRDVRRIKIGLSQEDKINMRTEIATPINEHLNTEIARLDNTIKGLGNLEPSGTASSNEILSFNENKGIYVGTDTGEWYYYVVAGIYNVIIVQGNVKLPRTLIVSKNGNQIIQYMAFDIGHQGRMTTTTFSGVEWEYHYNLLDENGSIETENLKDGSVTPEKTSFFEIEGTNLLDINNDIIIGFYIEGTSNCFTDKDNLYKAHNSMLATKPIKVEGGKTLYVRSIYSSIGRVFEYKEDGTFIYGHNAIKGEPIEENQWININHQTITLNENTRYVIISCNNSENYYKKYLALSYEPITNYYIKVKKYNIKEEYNSNIYGKSIAYFGDSLMDGLELRGNGFVDDVYGGIWKRLNEKYNLNMIGKYSIGGSCIQRLNENDTNSISHQMYNYDNSNTSIILFTGGFNDTWKYQSNEEGYILGELPTENVSEWTALNNETSWNSLIGSLHNAILHLRNTNPETNIIYIKAWRGTTNEYIKSTYDKIEELLNLWGVPIIDVYKDCRFNLNNEKDKIAFGRKNYLNATEFEYDYIHLSSKGYDKIMAVIESRLNAVINK